MARTIHHELGFDMESSGASAPLAALFNISARLAGRNTPDGEEAAPALPDGEHISKHLSVQQFTEEVLDDCAGDSARPNAHATSRPLESF